MHSLLTSVIEKNFLQSPDERKKLVFLHALLQFASVGCLGLGFASVYYHKPAGKHFMTLHGLVGLAAIFLSCANLLYACLKSVVSFRLFKLWSDGFHRALGNTAFLLCILACALGLFNKVKGFFSKSSRNRAHLLFTLHKLNRYYVAVACGFTHWQHVFFISGGGPV